MASVPGRAEVERSEGEARIRTLSGHLQSAAADVRGTSAEAAYSVPGSSSRSELMGPINSWRRVNARPYIRESPGGDTLAPLFMASH